MQAPSRRHVLAAGAALGLSPLLRNAALAAPADLADLARRAEGEVTYYASTNPVLSQRLVTLFNATYPSVKVNIVRLASGPLGRRYASEAEAGNVVADLLQLGDPLLMEEGQGKGWFASMEELPAHAAWPAGFKESYSATVSLFPHTITYNTNLVRGADVPTGWESILADKWQRRILMADPRNSPTLVEWLALVHDSYGPDYLRRLSRLRPRIVASTVPGTQLVAAGEAAFVLPNLRMVSYSLIEQRAPLEDVTPSPNSGLESILAISARAKSPNAARLLADFILSRPGQEVLSKDTAASPLENIPGALPLPPGYHRARIREAIARGPELLRLIDIE